MGSPWWYERTPEKWRGGNYYTFLVRVAASGALVEGRRAALTRTAAITPCAVLVRKTFLPGAETRARIAPEEIGLGPLDGAPRYLHLEIIFMVRCGSKNHGLFIAEDTNGIDLGSAASWDVAGGEGYGGKQRGHTSEGEQIGGSDAEEEASH
jgi:hypothetical protein